MNVYSDTIIAPSLLASDFSQLYTEVQKIEESKAQWLHLDVMDGSFVPNISFGFPVIEAIRPHFSRHFDVHLMIVNPDKYLEECKRVGAQSISVHIEACPHLHRTIQHIKSLDCLAGVAVNPHTSVNQLVDILQEVDFVNLMSVNPGFGGQKFIDRTLDKVREVRRMAKDQQTEVGIQLDGGVGPANIQACKDAGATIFVAGSAVFKAENSANAIEEMLG